VSVFSVSLRGLLFRPRSLALAAVPLFTAVVSLLVLVAGDSESADEAYAGLTGQLLVPLVVAFVSLIMGVSAFTDDREDGTLLLLMATPLPRWSIVGQKLAAAWLTVQALCLPATVTCALLGVRSSAGTGEAVAATVGSVLLTGLAYCAVFLLLSLVTRRAVLAGAFYIVLWEGTVANFAAAADSLSIGAYGRAIVASVIPDAGLDSAADVSALTAVIVLLIVSAAAFALASWRLPRAQLR
jgi:ABC-2 type transport system permease protein